MMFMTYVSALRWASPLLTGAIAVTGPVCQVLDVMNRCPHQVIRVARVSGRGCRMKKRRANSLLMEQALRWRAYERIEANYAIIKARKRCRHTLPRRPMRSDLMKPWFRKSLRSGSEWTGCRALPSPCLDSNSYE